MSVNLITLITLLSPAAFIATAIASWYQPGLRPKFIKRMSIVCATTGIGIAALSGFFVIKHGIIESGFIGMNDLGFSIRLDSLSALMLGMIALLGFIIIKFSSNYLDGDERQGAFIGRLAATLASVQLLVLSGNLGILLISWIFTSISLHRLLVFYPERPGAVIAAKKKFILARLGDASLVIAAGLLYSKYGSGNLETIFNAIQNTSLTDLPFMAVEGPALFLVLAALLKSAQFPTHGWLIEVMETPTPVSALLHAGLLNAGPFLIIRMAYVMEASTVAPLFLMGIGGLTAVFASVAYLTQTSIKTALGYSSVAHMGFSLMICGLGVYPAAMLHLLAHSFYKAHAFLSSGSVIDVMRASKMPNPVSSDTPLRIVMGIGMALGLYIGAAMIWGFDFRKDVPLLFIGGIIVLGLWRILSSAIGYKGSYGVILQAVLMALVVTVAFFTLESATHFLMHSQLPIRNEPGLGKVVIAGVLFGAFTITVFAQILTPRLSQKPFYKLMAIHLKNGLYANAIFDKLINSLGTYSPYQEQMIRHNLQNQKTRNTGKQRA